MWRKLPCQTLSKALAILSDTTVRRSAVNWEDLQLYWKLEKRPQFSRCSKIFIIYKFLKDFTNHRKKTSRVVDFSCRPFPNILKYRTPMKPSNNLENKAPSDTYWRFQLVCKKVQALEPPLEYNPDQMPLTNQGSLWPF